MAASFSGRYADTSKKSDPIPKPDGPPPGGGIEKKEKVQPSVIPPTKVVSRGAAEDEANPYLKDSPYYTQSMKDKVQKGEIAQTEPMTGAQRIAARRAAAMERAKNNDMSDVDADSSVVSSVPHPPTEESDKNILPPKKQPSDYQKKKEENYQKAKTDYFFNKKKDSMQREQNMRSIDENGDDILPQAVRYDEDIHRQPFDQPKYRDIFWTLIFTAHVISIVILAIIRGIPEYYVLLNENSSSGQVEYENSHKDMRVLDDYNDDTYNVLNDMDKYDLLSNRAGSNTQSGSPDEMEKLKVRGEGSVSNLTASILTLAVTSAMSAFAGFLLFEMALASPTSMIQFGLGGLVIASASIACVMILTGPDIIGALLWSVITAFVICFVINIQDSVAFAAANLSTAAAAIKKHRQTLSVAGGALFMQLVWLSVWMVAVLGVGLRNHRVRQESMPPSSYAYSSFAQHALQHQFSPGGGVMDTGGQISIINVSIAVPISTPSNNFSNYSYYDDDVTVDDAFYFPPNGGYDDDNNNYGKGNDDNNGYGKGNDDNNGYGKGNDDNNGYSKGNDDNNGYGKGNDDNNGYGKGNDDNNGYGKGNDDNGYGKGNDDNNGYGIGNDDNNGYGKGNDDNNNYGKGNDDNNGYGKGNDDNNNYGKGNDDNNNHGKGNDDNNGYGKGNDDNGYGKSSNGSGNGNANGNNNGQGEQHTYSSGDNNSGGKNGKNTGKSGKHQNKNGKEVARDDDDDHPEQGVAGLFGLRKLVDYTSYDQNFDGGDDHLHSHSHYAPIGNNDDPSRPPHSYPSYPGSMPAAAPTTTDDQTAPENQDETSDYGVYDGDDALGEFFGLGPGCRTLIVDYKTSARLGLFVANGTVDVYCACASGRLVSSGRCDTADYARIELKNGCWMYMLLALSLYWGGQVLSGIVHVTSSGTVGAWWFGASAYSQKGSAKFAYSQLKDQEKGESDFNSENNTTAAGADSEKPLSAAERRLALSNKTGENVKKNVGELDQELQQGINAQNIPILDTATTVVNASLNRALGPSFGSICLGALFVAFFSTLETMFRYLRKTCFKSEDEPGNGGICCACVFCLDACLRVLREIMEYFNRWAFTYVAIYGDSFMSAGRNACLLFKRRGWTSVLADTLCATSLRFASMTVAVFVGIVAYFIATLFDAISMRSLLVVASVVIAYMICTCVTSVLDAGVLAVLICFAEDPNPCSQNHPEEFNKLVSAWSKVYGPELEVAGYDRFLQD